MRTAFTFLAFLAMAASAAAMLGPTTLPAFVRTAKCAFVGQVIDVATVTTDERLNVVASVAVKQIISAGACPTSPTLRVYFSSEVHSSQPVVGETAVLFPAERDGRFVEAVYGRSYWPLLSFGETQYVEVTWRNDFLIRSGFIPSGESALLELITVERLLTTPPADYESAECNMVLGLLEQACPEYEAKPRDQ